MLTSPQRKQLHTDAMKQFLSNPHRWQIPFHLRPTGSPNLASPEYHHHPLGVLTTSMPEVNFSLTTSHLLNQRFGVAVKDQETDRVPQIVRHQQQLFILEVPNHSFEAKNQPTTPIENYAFHLMMNKVLLLIDDVFSHLKTFQEIPNSDHQQRMILQHLSQEWSEKAKPYLLTQE